MRTGSSIRFTFAAAALSMLIAQCNFLGEDNYAGTNTGTENTFGAAPITQGKVTGRIRLANGAPATGAIVSVRAEQLVRRPDGSVEPMGIIQDTADVDGGFQVLFSQAYGTLYLEIRQPGPAGEAYFKKFQVLSPQYQPVALSKSGSDLGPAADTPAADSVEHFRLAPTGALTFRLVPKSIPASETFWLGMAGSRAFTTAIATQGIAGATSYRLEGIPSGTNSLVLARTDTPQGGILSPDTLATVEIKPAQTTDFGQIVY